VTLQTFRTSARCLALGALLFGLPAESFARSELLRIQHPNADTVSGFRVYVGNAPGVYQTALDIGKPVPANGIYSYTLEVPDSNSVYVAIGAYGPTGLESVKSNEQLRLGNLGAPGKPQIQP
jgi:hypothetical protein